ncbi:endoglucanase E-4-like [Ostrea edulis]|uniref:endoglucanase E-4-like n=1 Tax=Ostrea edulis TaxID=37623 RepID=UPI0024AF5669|nr:endoglucanase E-4-like [Ostrea edulis]
MFVRIVCLLVVTFTRGHALHTDMSRVNDWGNGRFEGHITFPIHGEAVGGWECIVTFSEPVTGLSEWMGDIIKHSSDNKVYVLVNKPHTGIQTDGQTLDITIQASYTGSKAPTATAELINLAHDGMKPPTISVDDGTKYNYNEVLMKSIMFYEAQRSGKLPADNRITWRGDSSLLDQGDNGEDLTGGWYDAGDNIKFGFPMAATTTILSWGLLRYKDAYTHSGQLDNMYDCIRWSLEWLLKCHTGTNELYVQVGDGKSHSIWDRPESMTTRQPAFKVDASKPGSDVAGEYAAAMAAGYLAFKDKDPVFAAKLLEHAKQINDFAVAHKGKYSDSVTAAAEFYRSVDYNDELSWAGAWLYKATNETKYLTQAETYYVAGPSWGQSWDDKTAGCQVLLYEETGKDKYKQDIESTFQDWMPGGSVPYSPQGLAFRSQWGSLRYTSNMAFIALMAADDGLHATSYRDWAKSQIHYALGDTGRSFMCGFGVNPPVKPHHRGASCPTLPAPCGWADQTKKAPNPHVLYGALVGGPDGSDGYVDSRQNFQSNEVACDYNAGFQSAVAGLESLFLRGMLSSS